MAESSHKDDIRIRALTRPPNIKRKITLTMRNPQFYSPEFVRANYPSVFATSHDGKRSDSYAFIPSSEIIERMEKLDFGITNVRVPKVRKVDPEHCRHELTFTPKDPNFYFEDPRMRVINHHDYHLDAAQIRPELRIVNSSDGSCAFTAFVGLMALICANGLVVSAGAIGEINLKHLNFDPMEAIRLVEEFSSKVPLVMEKVQSWGDIQLTAAERSQFAFAAAALRWETPTFDPNMLLMSRRNEDTQSDLWTTFNVVQENLIKGGFSPNVPKARKVRTLSNIVKSNEVNDNLWQLAETFAQD